MKLKVLLLSSMIIALVGCQTNFSEEGDQEHKNSTAHEIEKDNKGIKEQPTEKENVKDQDESLEQVEEKQPIKITISAAGDCTLGSDDALNKELAADKNYRTFLQVYEEQGHNTGYFFEKVYPIFSKDDLTLVNLETTFTNATEKANKKWRFKGDPEFTNILVDGSVEAVTLANNHIYDYLNKGYQDTVHYLEQANIKYVSEAIWDTVEVKGINIGLIGLTGFVDVTSKKKVIEERIKALKDENCQIIIINFHWGKEYTNYPNEQQQELAHFSIDQGADLVIGHHPHVIQGIERYKEKYIVYSLGNFSFGGNVDPPDYDTFIFQQTFEFENESDPLYDQSIINLIPCSLSSVSTHNNYQPIPLEGEAKKRVIDRLNEYSSSLSFEYDD